jgi:hypothetical protein
MPAAAAGAPRTAATAAGARRRGRAASWRAPAPRQPVDTPPRRSPTTLSACSWLATPTTGPQREGERDGRRQRGTLQLWERKWGISAGGCVLCGLLFPLSLARPPLTRVKRQLINQRLFFVAFSSRRRLLSLPCFAQQSVLSTQIFFPFIFPLF